MIRDPEQLWRIAQYQRLAAINFEKIDTAADKAARIMFQRLAQTYYRIARHLMGIENER